MPDFPIVPFVSRAGLKLAHALSHFAIDPNGLVCADLGSNVGGFVDCLLLRGAARVYSIDTGYGVLAWKLRKDPRVIVMERTNAMHATLPEPIQLITIDVAWTKQKNILPAAARMLAANGQVVALIKPHYEAPRDALKKGVTVAEQVEPILQSVRAEIAQLGWEIIGVTESPIRGAKGNVEFLAHLRRAPLAG